MRYLPMHLRLPGRCGSCGAGITFDGKRWTDRPRVAHVCPQERPTCGALMPNVRERCARTPGHRYEHRSRYALDNALRVATGRGLAHDVSDGVSVAPHG